MKVNQRSILDFLGQPNVQFVIPVYQRVYSWKRPQLRELWDDIMSAGAEDRSHFLGTIFYSLESSHHTDVEQFNIIDGQQRLTTLTLLMCAVCKYLNAHDLKLDGLSGQEVVDMFLKITTKDGDQCKLVLSRADAPTLRWVVGAGEKPATEEEYSELVVKTYEWFCDRLENESFDFNTFEKGLNHVYICTVLMEANDRSQTVFESLNSKGLPLSTPDLVRNFLLMHAGSDDKSYLYNKYWAEVEDAFAGDADDRYLAHAIRIWSGGGPTVKDDRGIFEAFKASFPIKDSEAVEKRTANLATYCIDFHKKIADGDEATIKLCREWEENRGKAERLSNNRKIFGD